MNKPVIPQIYPVTSHTEHVGPGSTFVAIKGMKEDGIAYIEQALVRGATTIVVEEDTNVPTNLRSLIKEKNARLLFEPDARLALAILCAQAHNYPSSDMCIIAVTGTKGKTTTAFLIEHILKTAGYKTALLSTVKNTILDTSFEAHLTTPQPDYLHTFLSACLIRECGML